MSKIVYSGHVYESVHDAVVNNKVIWITYLREKYTDHKNLDNLYVSFVEIDKVGINPKTIWNTPVGVYSYPMSYVLKVGKVPFMGHENKATKVKVIEALTDNKLTNNLTVNQFQQGLVKLQELVKKEDFKLDMSFLAFIDNAIETATNDSPFGHLWNVTRILSADFHRMVRKNGKDILSRKQNIYYWTKLLMYLGYDYVVDNGEGIIHTNEPTQAVFFNPKSYRVIDETFVDSTHKQIVLTDDDRRKVITALRKGTWSEDLVKEVLKLNDCSIFKLADKNNRDYLTHILLNPVVTIKDVTKTIRCFIKDGKLIDEEDVSKSLMYTLYKNADLFIYMTSNYFIHDNTFAYYSHFMYSVFSVAVKSFSEERIKSANYLLNKLIFPDMFYNIDYIRFAQFMELYYVGPNKDLILDEYSKYIHAGEKSLENLDTELASIK